MRVDTGAGDGCHSTIAYARIRTIARAPSIDTRASRPQAVVVGMSAACAMAEELLFAGFGSISEAVTVAVFVTAMPAEATSNEIVAVAPAGIVEISQTMVVVPLQEPAEGCAETNVVPGGRTSVTITLVAESGPALATVIVNAMEPPE